LPGELWYFIIIFIRHVNRYWHFFLCMWQLMFCWSQLFNNSDFTPFPAYTWRFDACKFCKKGRCKRFQPFWNRLIFRTEMETQNKNSQAHWYCSKCQNKSQVHCWKKTRTYTINATTWTIFQITRSIIIWTTVVTSVEGTAYPSGAHDFTHGPAF